MSAKVVCIPIKCGETTCASAPGKFCRFLGGAKFGQVPVCRLFPSEAGSYTELDDSSGWALRCQACLDNTLDAKKAHSVEAEYECFDEAWKRMEKQRDEAVEQRDKAKTQLKHTRDTVKLVAAERDAARLEAARPSAWLLSEGNMLVHKFAAIQEMLSVHGCECACDHACEDDHDEDCERRCLACRIEAVLKGKADEA